MEGFAAHDPGFEPRALVPGSRLGNHEIVRRLAVGGMAELYLARVIGVSGFEKLVVAKRVHPHLASDANFIRMFLNEARLAATLDHPNVTQVMNIGVSHGEHFFTMEYLHGEDLRRVLEKAAPDGPLPLECAIEVVAAVARGLHHAHERHGPDGRPLGLVHRDVSPSNVLLTYEGGVKVVDFGIAKAGALTKQTTAGTLKGKIGYMSPEQCRGDPVDRRSDVFALGILLYETTTARRLFVAGSQYGVLNKIIEGRYAPPSAVTEDYPDELEAIVTRALATDPADRFETAEAMELALEDFAHCNHLRTSPRVLAQYLEGLLGHRPYPTAEIPTQTRPIRTGGTERRILVPGSVASSTTPDPPRRQWRIVPYAMVGLAALGAGLGMGGVFRSEASPAPSVAPAAAPAVQPEPAVEPPGVATPTLQPPASDVEPPVAQPPASEAEPPVVEPPATTTSEPAARSSSAKPTRKKRRRSKGKRKTTQAGKSLYPPSYYE
ncbi:MAG: serine/threonine protein kinase [Deltaproteobacteria bacterium]|nr:serine/threonine protein kinase [Deltaproteobacteria bacterium]